LEEICPPRQRPINLTSGTTYIQEQDLRNTGGVADSRGAGRLELASPYHLRAATEVGCLWTSIGASNYEEQRVFMGPRGASNFLAYLRRGWGAWLISLNGGAQHRQQVKAHAHPERQSDSDDHFQKWRKREFFRKRGSLTLILTARQYDRLVLY